MSTACAVLMWPALYAAGSFQPSSSADPDRFPYSARSPQAPQRDPATLGREAAELAERARSLVTELQQLETERDRQGARVRDAELAMTASAAALASLDNRLQALEQQRLARMPELKRRFVDLYKRGRRPTIPLLMTAGSVREAARATRAAGALARVDQEGIAAQRDTLENIRRQRAAQAEQSRIYEQQRAAAEQARRAAGRAVEIRTALLRQIEERRDLSARLAGELEAAGNRLQQRMTALAAEPPPGASPSTVAASPPAVGANPSVIGASPPPLRPGAPLVRVIPPPLRSARSTLEWPVPGRITRAFGQTAAGFEGSATRNGIDIGAETDTPVRAVYAGLVAYAEPFEGFGTLVILDHGATSYTLYGYLTGVGVRRGERVEAGQELGRVGNPPAGGPALYFEVRVDGRPVDPVQWLKPR